MLALSPGMAHLESIRNFVVDVVLKGGMGFARDLVRQHALTEPDPAILCVVFPLRCSLCTVCLSHVIG